MKKFLRRFSRLNRDFEGIARPTVQKAFVNRPQWSVFANNLLVQWNLRAEKACTHRSEERLRVWKAFFRSAICGIPLCRSSFARKYGLLRQVSLGKMKVVCVLSLNWQKASFAITTVL